MSKKRLVSFLIIIIGLVWFSFKISNNGNNKSLINPSAGKIIPSSSPISTSKTESPKTFKFDKTTDLKKELDSINPQVLESDFQ